MRDLPQQTAEAKPHLAHIEADVTSRQANDSDEFAMNVGNRVFSGRGARVEAAKALTHPAPTWGRHQRTIAV